ncbi:CHAP domain-containing protein [Fulvivirga maritima]|uniref:CHAP domain-containing protein n=1 Tax=Fulvivirga maritima TaxID=2904247 RepID=UPI001F2C8DCC|nr:CHAP domain-containing protein [Fulvivirga maritima]UII28973.1 CHAP domain-containing protein [Fulvivirga maritima]
MPNFYAAKKHVTSLNNTPPDSSEAYPEDSSAPDIFLYSDPQPHDIVKTTKAISEYYLIEPLEGEDQLLPEEKIILISECTKQTIDQENWYKLSTNTTEGEKSGWFQEKDAEKVSAFDWTLFGWNHISAGTDYVYSVKEVLEAKENNTFLCSIWDIVDANKDKILDQHEWRNAYKRKEIVSAFSKLVCQHKNEWAYTPNDIKPDMEQLFDIGISLEKDPDLKNKLQERKQFRMKLLEERIKHLSFWKDLKSGEFKKEEIDESKLWNTRLSFLPPGFSDENKEDEYIPGPVGKGTPPEKDPPRTIPSSDNVWHFHPIAFVEHMRLITGDRAPWMEIALQEALEYKGLDENTGSLAIAIQEKYHTYTGHPTTTGKISWCASFASWCLGNSNFKNPKSWSSQSFLNHSSLKKSKIQYGAIVVFTDCYENGEIKYDENGNSFGHVTFVIGKLDNGKHLCLGGNQGNKIKISDYDCSGSIFPLNRKKTK